MPLLANKLYVLNKTKKDKKDDDQILSHPLTNEICDNAEELARKTFLYNQKIWTCRITGQINLTFKEAQKSEQGCAKMLKNSFMKCYEPSVLQYVHHNRESLENIIHRAWTQIHEEYAVNEPVSIKLTTPKQLLLKGVVVKIDRTPHVPEPEGGASPKKINSESSSSDKENIKKKIVPIKKNYRYSVKLFDMDKLVNDIPSDTIERTLRPPSKDQIRMFIRAHAIRHFGKPVNPWVVEEDLVKKYKLTHTEPDFIFDKAKIKEMSHNAEIQMYCKLIEDIQKKENDTTVDLTKSDDEDTVKKPRRSVESAASKKMKQMTLLDMRNSSSGTAAGRAAQKIKSPFSSPTRSMPPVAQQLLRMMKEDKKDNTVNHLILKCCKYTDSQIEKFPELIREPIKEKKEKLELKKKLKNMTPEEREAYMLERRNEQRQLMKEKKRETCKVEDDEVDNGTAVVEGRPLSVLGEMTHDQWARIVSLSEFVRCFKGILGEARAEQAGDLTVDDFCRAVVGAKDRDRCLFAEIVCLFLKPLLQDPKMSERKELGVRIGDFPVTVCTAGELLRLMLSVSGESLEEPVATVTTEEMNTEEQAIVLDTEEHQIKPETNVTKENVTHNNLIASPIIDHLAANDLDTLSIDEKIIAMELLQSQLLELESVGQFIDDCQRESTEAYKRRQSDLKDANDRLRVVRAEMCKMKVSLSSVVADSAETTARIEEENNTVLPMAARRRLSLEQKTREAEEREKRTEMERQYQRMEREEVQCKRMIEDAHSNYNAALNEARQLMRVQPLGVDRCARRYWLFRTVEDVVVYVETEVNGGESTTWSVHDTVAGLEALIASLNERAVRESLLRKELLSVLPKLTEQIQRRQEEGGQSKNDENDQSKNDKVEGEEDESFLVRGFKDELRETELNIRQGSLGGVEDYDGFEQLLADQSDLAAMKQSLTVVFLAVHDRFWSGVLKSASGRADYVDSIERCPSQSRLNLLQCLLDICVCWSKSASDDKCRVCHKSDQEASMLLCDSCNRAYHIYCLRPSLARIPDGDWMCPRCRPRAGGAVVKDEAEVAGDGDGECCVCGEVGGDEEPLGKCDGCESLYHAQCHEPPMRHIHRASWLCAQCRVVAGHRKDTAHNGNHVAEGEDDEGEAEEDEPEKTAKKQSKRKAIESDNDDMVSVAKPTKRTRKKPAATNGKEDRSRKTQKRRAPETEESDDEEAVAVVKSTRRTKKKVIDSEDDDEVVKTKSSRRSKRKSAVSKDNSAGSQSNESAEDRDDDDEEDEAETERVPKKRTSQGRPNAVKRRRTVASTEDHRNRCIKTLLRQMMGQRCSWPFRDAVDRDEVPDYYLIVKRPMDLSRMIERHQDRDYGVSNGVRLFLDDVGLMFENADLYNEAESEVMQLAMDLEDFFLAAYGKCDLGEKYERRISK